MFLFCAHIDRGVQSEKPNQKKKKTTKQTQYSNLNGLNMCIPSTGSDSVSPLAFVKDASMWPINILTRWLTPCSGFAL